VLSAMEDMQPNRPGDPDRDEATTAACGAVGEHALSRLRETLAEHLSGDGVWFDSSAWIVTARRHAEGQS
jgi:hypothetical protein